MNYKVGDKVKIKKNLYGYDSKHSGENGVIVKIENNLYRVAFDNKLNEVYMIKEYYWYFDVELELVSIDKHIFGDGTNVDLIAEIKILQAKINILLNRLENNLHE